MAGKKPSRKKWFVIVGIVAALGLMVMGRALLGGGTDLPVVGTTALARREIQRTVTLKAPLEGMDKAEVVSSLHCTVEELKIAEGDQVVQGQLLAVLEDKDLLLAVQKARDQLELAQYQYQEALAESRRLYAKAAEALAAADMGHQRAAALYEAGSLSLKELETAKETWQDLQRQVAAYPVAGGNVILSSAQQKQLDIYAKAVAEAEDKLSQSQVISPIDGIVTRVNIRVGRFADETENDAPMFVIENLSKLQMKVQVSEYDIGEVKVGQQATVTADILNGAAVDAAVSRISPTGEAKTPGGSERVIPTIIDIKGADAQLIAGINAKAMILLAQATDTFVVPLEALVEAEADQWQVYRVTADNVLELVDVTLGVENDLEVEIFSQDLQEGDRIVNMATPLLAPGMEVAADHD